MSALVILLPSPLSVLFSWTSPLEQIHSSIRFALELQPSVTKHFHCRFYPLGSWSAMWMPAAERYRLLSVVLAMYPASSRLHLHSSWAMSANFVRRPTSSEVMWSCILCVPLPLASQPFSLHPLLLSTNTVLRTPWRHGYRMEQLNLCFRRQVVIEN